jgi:hypothetical protein
MKHHRMVLILLAVLAAAGAGRAQSPDFSGEWKLDPSRGDLGGMSMMGAEMSLSIRQEAGAVSLRRTVAGRELTTVKSTRYTLDGKECLNAGESLKDLKGTAVLEKGRLVIRSEQEGATMKVQGDNHQIDYFKYDSVEELSLSADGKTLTLVQTGQLPEGPRRTTFVFVKTAS